MQHKGVLKHHWLTAFILPIGISLGFFFHILCTLLLALQYLFSLFPIPFHSVIF